MKFFKIIIFSLIFSSCDFFSSTDWREEKYYVQDDAGSAYGKTLYYELENGNGVGRVEFVSKIGSDDKYLIIESQQTTENQKEYWILDKTKDGGQFNASQIVEGPLSKSEFLNKKKEYGIGNLEFIREFD